MSKKANPTVIGSFVIGAITLLLIAITMFGSMRIFSSKETYILFFEDSVNGLAIGAPVKLKGVPIGMVTKIMLHFNQGDDTVRIPVLIELDKKKIDSFFKSRSPHAKGDMLEIETKEGLRAKLAYESIVTGILFIELDYVQNPPPPKFFQEKFIFREIPTVSTSYSQVVQEAASAIAKISSIDFDKLGKRLDSIFGKLDEGIKDIQFKQINDSFISAADSVKIFFSSEELDKAVISLEDAMAKLGQLSADIKEVARPTIEDINKASIEIREAFKDFKHTLENVDSVFNPDSEFSYELNEALHNFSGASKSVKELVDSLERNPNQLLSGKPANAE